MRRTDALGVAGIVAVLCSAGLPAVVAFVGGLTLVGLLGGSLVVWLFVAATGTLVVRARRRRACSPTAAGRPRRS